MAEIEDTRNPTAADSCRPKREVWLRSRRIVARHTYRQPPRVLKAPPSERAVLAEEAWNMIYGLPIEGARKVKSLYDWLISVVREGREIVLVDPLVALSAEWIAIDGRDWDGLSNDEIDADTARMRALWQSMVDTPAATVPGMGAKLRALKQLYSLDGSSDDIAEQMLASVFRDAEKLIGNPAAPS